MKAIESKADVAITFTREQQERYRKAWASMPYGGGLALDYAIEPDAILRNLERLVKRLSETSEANREREKELDAIRKDVAAFGSLLARANSLATAPDNKPLFSGPCILTGAPGENPDDCTTHDHEP